MKKVLTIAGSDSSGGAGIQADLKTFSALGVFGATVITVLTAQNTKTISDIFVTSPKFFKNQLVTTIQDLQPDVIKIGVIYNRSLIKIIFDVLNKYENPIVVDPVLISGTGVELLREQDYELYKNKILPLSFIITPNINEAEKLSGMKINDQEDLKECASKLFDLGPENIIIKGGHFRVRENKVADFLFERKKNRTHKLLHDWIRIGKLHGTGCNFSSSLTAFLAKGYSVYQSFTLSTAYTYSGLKNAQKFGTDRLITDPIYEMYNNSERFKILKELKHSVSQLEDISDFFLLLPEVKTNFVYSLENPKDIYDVAGVEGRITNLGKKIRTPNIIEFGASSHLADAIISASKFNPSFRSVINIKNNAEILKICKEEYIYSSYSREEEPTSTKKLDGSTITWGIKMAFNKIKNAQIVYHEGDFGKEPMILIFGKNPHEIVEIIRSILRKLKEK